MATVLNLNERTRTSGNGEDRPILPTDMYRMRVIDAKLENDTFAKPEKDGSLPQKISLTWEITTLTEEQQEAADEAGQDWSAVRVWHRFNPFYGDVKAGGPSKFKAFVDDLIKWGLLVIPDMNAFDVETFVGIELRCSVQHYLKTMGENAGKPGNKIVAFAPVRKPSKAKNAPEPTTVDQPDDTGLPF